MLTASELRTKHGADGIRALHVHSIGCLLCFHCQEYLLENTGNNVQFNVTSPDRPENIMGVLAQTEV